MSSWIAKADYSLRQIRRISIAMSKKDAQHPNIYLTQSYDIWGVAVVDSLEEFKEAYCNKRFREIIVHRNIMKRKLIGSDFPQDEQDKIITYLIDKGYGLGANNLRIIQNIDKCENLIDTYCETRRRFQFGFDGRVSLKDFANMVLDAYAAGQNPIRIKTASLVTGQILTTENKAALCQFLQDCGMPPGKFSHTMYWGDECNIFSLNATDILYTFEV